MKINYDSDITCPVCKHVKTEQMPLDTCLYFYECENCKSLIRPMPGDCCVFCSYGSNKCPSIQLKEKNTHPGN